jgi:hypothetical protein
MDVAGGVLTPGEVTEEKLLIDEEALRNWLMLALLGEGGRCEKSRGAKCLRMS